MEPRRPQGNAKWLWTDDDELTFLTHLGTNLYLGHETSRMVKEKSRLTLLHLYLQAAMRRNNWGVMDAHRILAACRTMIHEETRRVTTEA